MAPLVIVAAVVVAIFAVIGLREGVVRRLVEIAGALLTVVLTARFAAGLTPRVTAATGWDEGAALLAAWVALIIAGLLLSRLLAVLVSRTIRLTLLGWVDRAGGLVCGGLFGLLVASMLVNVVAAVGGEDARASLRADPAGRFVAEAAPAIAHQARLLAGDRFADYWERLRADADARLDAARAEAERRAAAAAREASGD